MGDLETNETSEMHKNIRHHSKFSTLIIVLIFVVAAITWLIHVPTGILLTVIGGVVFGLTYK
ncbi:MAG: hypothetical protein ACI4EJ_01945 [Bacteroides sp.]